jgi:AMP-polyphosphate phosphotransferase
MLRDQVLAAQTKFLSGDASLVVLLLGNAGAGKSEVANMLCEWLDARNIKTVAFDPRVPATERKEFEALPAKGKTAIHFGGAYGHAVHTYFHALADKRGASKQAARVFEKALTEINALEGMLASSGVRLVKLWIELDAKEQKKRLSSLEKSKDTRWRVSKEDWFENKHAKQFAKARQAILEQTSTEMAPWHVISGADPEARDARAAQAVLQGYEAPLFGQSESKDAKGKKSAKKPGARADATVAKSRAQYKAPSEKDRVRKGINLGSFARDVRLSKDKYEAVIGEWQGKLNRLARELHAQKRSLVLAFEGTDAAGKGGAIRRISSALDARQYQIIPIAAPTEEERRYNYLWRFARKLPETGHVTIFDRTWYGRVLVERVEGFAKPEDWQRAYSEINAFEERLDREGIVLCKFWLAITKEEQQARFKERESTSYKQFKITSEDLRNRAKWEAYETAAQEMLDRTSTVNQPWHLIAANDKHHARIEVLKKICEALKEALS